MPLGLFLVGFGWIKMVELDVRLKWVLGEILKAWWWKSGNFWTDFDRLKYTDWVRNGSNNLWD